MTVSWQYVAVAVFFLVGGGVIGWYISQRRKLQVSDQENLFMRATGGLLILLAIGSVLQISYFQYEQAQQSDKLSTITDCQYRVNKALIQVLSARQDPSQTKDDALVVMVKAVLNAKSPEAGRKALVDFIDATNNLNKARQDNPYPSIPADCRPQ